jgi:hypothetical protein
VFLQEPHQAADVIIMTMADDKRVHLAKINFHKFQVVRVDVRREAEIKQVAARFRALAGLDVQCQPPLAFQRLALCGRGKPNPANRKTWNLHARQKDVVRAVGDFPNCELIDHGRIDPNRSGVRRAIERNAASQQRAAKDG